ncbi:MAG: P-loop NTPase [Candidatus Aminicenantes bacterium]
MGKIPVLSFHSGSQKTIWAVGGGKGGTGKSFFTANLGLLLAQMGEDVVLIDADLGGPNLHTFFGLKKARTDLGHFISNEVPALKETLVPTPFDNLRLIKGTDDLLFTSNLNYYKKLKLMRHIKTFNTKRVVMDIGTGSSYNCVDFFLLSNPGILVINPEPTSIENSYYFLKSCIMRILNLYSRHYNIQDLFKKASSQVKNNSKSIYSFLEEIISHDQHYADLLYRALTRFQPRLVINKARDERDYYLGESITKVVQKHLVININYIGAIPFDEKIHLSVKKMIPFIHQFQNTPAGISFKNIAEKMVKTDKENPGYPP